MSYCTAIYRKVKEFVKCLYPGEPRGFFHRNLYTLTSMITSIIVGKETQLPQIANNVPEDIKVSSAEKRNFSIIYGAIQKILDNLIILCYAHNV